MPSVVSPLSGSLAQQINKAMGAIFLPATLTHSTATGGVAFDPGAPTNTAYPCKAIRDSYSSYEMASGLLLAGDVKILILAQSLAVTPQLQDSLTIQGATYTLMNVAGDPATAVWTCQGRS